MYDFVLLLQFLLIFLHCSPCEEYDREKDACDCGYIYDTPVTQIWVGILLGLCSVAFWGKCIGRSCPKE